MRIRSSQSSLLLRRRSLGIGLPGVIEACAERGEDFDHVSCQVTGGFRRVHYEQPPSIFCLAVSYPLMRLFVGSKRGSRSTRAAIRRPSSSTIMSVPGAANVIGRYA